LSLKCGDILLVSRTKIAFTHSSACSKNNTHLHRPTACASSTARRWSGSRRPRRTRRWWPRWTWWSSVRMAVAETTFLVNFTCPLSRKTLLSHRFTTHHRHNHVVITHPTKPQIQTQMFITQCKCRRLKSVHRRRRDTWFLIIRRGASRRGGWSQVSSEVGTGAAAPRDLRHRRPRPSRDASLLRGVRVRTRHGGRVAHGAPARAPGGGGGERECKCGW
jgi:hypothetical protein